MSMPCLVLFIQRFIQEQEKKYKYKNVLTLHYVVCTQIEIVPKKRKKQRYLVVINSKHQRQLVPSQ